MTVEQRINRLRSTIDALSERAGRDRSQFALTTAQMLAAAQYWPAEQDGLIGLLDEGQELTAREWAAILGKMDGIRRATQLLTGEPQDQGLAPFAPDPRISSFAPGWLEELRRAVRDVLAGTDLFATREAIGFVLQLPGLFWVRHGERSLAPEAVEMTMKSVSPKRGERAYCAYSGAAAVALSLAAEGVVVVLEVPEAETAAVWACLATALKVPMGVILGDPLHSLRLDFTSVEKRKAATAYDIAVIMTPLGLRSSLEDLPVGMGTRRTGSPDGFGVSMALVKAKRAGAIVVPNGFLFRTSLRALKEQVISQFGLSLVVSFPAGAVQQSGVGTSLVLFEPNRANESGVLMVDARAERGKGRPAFRPPGEINAAIEERRASEISHLATLDEIREQDLNLSVERYVLSPEARRTQELLGRSQTVSLDDIADLYRPQASPASAMRTAADSSEDEPAPLEVAVSDLDEVGLVQSPSKRLTGTPEDAQKLRKARLQPGDLLFVCKGSVGKVGYVRDIPGGETWVANQSFVILRLRRSSSIIDPRVLFRFLTSSAGQDLIRSLRVGATIQALQMADVRRLTVAVPDLSAQHEIAAEVDSIFDMQDQIQQLRREVAARQRSIWPDLAEPLWGAHHE
jgi:hypothetical protein